MGDNKINIRKLEADLWESADLLRAGSKLTSRGRVKSNWHDLIYYFNNWK